MLRRIITIVALLALAVLARLLAWPVGAFDGEVKDVRITGGLERSIVASIFEPAGFPAPALESTTPAVAGVPGAPSSTARPAVILCHGVHASRRHMEPLARALARRGHLVVTFDFGGEGDSESRSQTEEANNADVAAAIALARRSGASGPIALVGHSMGVLAAVGAALKDPTVTCVVALGQRPFSTPERPHTLLIAAGAMDAFHPLAPLRRAASESAGREIIPFETARDPKTGAVRRLVVAGTCEHAGEVYDGAILGHAVGFIEAAFAEATRPTVATGAPTPTNATAATEGVSDPYADAPLLLRPPIEASLRFVARVALAGAAALLGLTVAGLFGLAVPEGGRSARFARRLLSLGLLLLALSPLLAVRAGALSLDLARDAAPALLIGAAIANALIRKRSLGAPMDTRSAMATGFALYAGWVGGTMLGALPAIQSYPDLLLGLPIYLWQGVALRLHFSAETLAGSLVPASLAPPIDLASTAGAITAASAGATASGGETASGGILSGVMGLLSDGPWFLALIVVAEIVSPGRALGFMVNLALRVVRALGGPVTIPKGVAAKEGLASEAGGAAARAVALSRAKMAAILVGLLAVGAALFWKRAAEGLLAGEGAIGTVAMTGVRLLVLPAIATWMGVLALKLVERVRGRPFGETGPEGGGGTDSGA